MKATPIYQGIITGAVLLAFTLILYYLNVPSDSGYQYVVYALYAAGIMWTLIGYSRSPAYTWQFGGLFGQGFRCFMIVTLIMTIFAAGFSLSHPEFAEQDAKLYREYLEKEVKDKTPSEKDELAEAAKKNYTTRNIYTSVFGYLIIGAVITAAGAGVILSISRKT